MGEEDLKEIPLSAQSNPMDHRNDRHPLPAGDSRGIKSSAAPQENGVPADDKLAGADQMTGEEKNNVSGDPSEIKSSGISPENGVSADDFQPKTADENGKLAGDDRLTGEKKINRKADALLRPPSHLPQPEAPPGLTKARSTPAFAGEGGLRRPAPLADVSALGKYLRDRSSSFSAAIVRRISSLNDSPGPEPTEFHLSGLKVIVRLKGNRGPDEPEFDGQDRIKGRITFFSRSGCRDCGAVRSFFREKNLPFVEINIDVFPEREKDLIQRSGRAHVPQIFFNEKLLGGLVVLNSLRNSGEFDRRLMEMAGNRCPETAPSPPVYGFDDEDDTEKEQMDGMVGVARILRQRLPIQDRITRMKLVKNCFAGCELVEAVAHHLTCGREKAVEIGKELARKHFIHHVFGENGFEDGNNQFYRFLEHDPVIPKCFNFRGSTNDYEPKPATLVGQRLTKLMAAILEAYASDDRRHLDYARIGASEEFRRYANVVQDLQRVDLFTLSTDQKMAFFLNLYNAMVIHAIIRAGRPGAIDRRAFENDFQYIVGGYAFSPSAIRNGILRLNRRQPYALAKPFGSGDKRLELALLKVNPLIHFGLCNGTRSSPSVRFFSAQGVEVELRHATREFFLNGGMEVDLDKRTVYLTRIIKWYRTDFGQDKEILEWIMNYLDATKAGLLMHLLNDGGPVSIVYQNFNWSLNS